MPKFEKHIFICGNRRPPVTRMTCAVFAQLLTPEMAALTGDSMRKAAAKRSGLDARPAP